MKLSDCDAVILCGGKGTRIRNMLPEGQPKAMADINGRPFIKVLIDHLKKAGFERFTLCVGYGQDQIVEAVTPILSAGDCTFFCEHEQFGTGGALRMMLRSPAINLSVPFFLLNGDTITEGFNYQQALRLHDDDILTACRYNHKNNGIFIVSPGIETALEWEPRESFNLEDLPLHIAAAIITVPLPFIDIGSSAGLEMARERFK